LTLLTGVAFPLLLAAIGRPLFPRQADGSLLTCGGLVIGSELIRQEFSRPEYFQSRPSAAGKGYDGASSGGTNLGPNNPRLKNGGADFAGITQLAHEYRKLNGLAPHAPIPIDAVTRSASGLDPDISPANAALQIPRVARARGASEEAVRRIVCGPHERAAVWVSGQPAGAGPRTESSVRPNETMPTLHAALTSYALVGIHPFPFGGAGARSACRPVSRTREPARTHSPGSAVVPRRVGVTSLARCAPGRRDGSRGFFVPIWEGQNPRLQATALARSPRDTLEGCPNTDAARIPCSRSICTWYGLRSIGGQR